MAVAFSKAGDYFASAGVDEQVMVWKTNFDQIPYQDLIESRQQKNTNMGQDQVGSSHSLNPQAYVSRDQKKTASSSSASQSNHHHFSSDQMNANNNNVIHARQMSNRDVSPLTIPLNESIAKG